MLICVHRFLIIMLWAKILTRQKKKAVALLWRPRCCYIVFLHFRYDTKLFFSFRMLIFLALNERFRSEKETGKVSNLIVILNLTTTNHKVEKGVKPCSHLILSMFLTKKEKPFQSCSHISKSHIRIIQNLNSNILLHFP